MLANIKKLFQGENTRKATSEDRAHVMFQRYAREQFLRLKEKGLSITVMTL